LVSFFHPKHKSEGRLTDTDAGALVIWRWMTTKI
jgi:hypothetical protein